MGIFDLLKSLLAGGGQPAPQGDAQNTPLTGDFGTTPPPPSAPAPTPLTGDFGPTPPGAGSVSGAIQPPSAPAPAPTPQPSTPPSTDQGLGGFLSHMVQKATTRDPSTGMGFMDKLGQVGRYMTDSSGSTQGAEAQGQAEAASRVAVAKRAKLQQMADSLGMSPREKLIFLADPEAWTKANATSLETATVPGGDSRVNGATGATTTAPKVGVEAGEGYSATPTKVTDTGSLAVSPQQQVQDDIKRAQTEAEALFHQILARAAVERAHADTTRANKPALGNGGDWRSRVVGHGSVQ